MAAQIRTELDEVHENFALTLKIVYFWMNKFKCDRTWVENKAHFGRPIKVTRRIVEKNP